MSASEPSCEPQAAARRDLHLAARDAPEARLDRRDCVGGLEQRGDVGLGEVERHGPEVYEAAHQPS